MSDLHDHIIVSCLVRTYSAGILAASAAAASIAYLMIVSTRERLSALLPY